MNLRAPVPGKQKKSLDVRETRNLLSDIVVLLAERGPLCVLRQEKSMGLLSFVSVLL